MEGWSGKGGVGRGGGSVLSDMILVTHMKMVRELQDLSKKFYRRRKGERERERERERKRERKSQRERQ